MKPRTLDLQYDYGAHRPEAQRWECVDGNSYDTNPDGVGSFIGRGATQKEASEDLRRQFADYDAAQHGE